MNTIHILIIIFVSGAILCLIATKATNYLLEKYDKRKINERDITDDAIIEKNIQPNKVSNWIMAVLIIKLIFIFRQIIACCVPLVSFEYAICNWAYIPLLIIILFKLVATFMLIGYKKKGFYFLCLAEILSLIPSYFITKAISTAYNSESLIADIIFVNSSNTDMISFWIYVAKSFIWIGIIWGVLQIKRNGIKGWDILK